MIPTDVSLSLLLSRPGPGGLLCGGAAGRQPVPAAGHGLGDHQGEGHPEQGQRRGLVPCGHPEGRTLRSESGRSRLGLEGSDQFCPVPIQCYLMCMCVCLCVCGGGGCCVPSVQPDDWTTIKITDWMILHTSHTVTIYSTNST